MCVWLRVVMTDGDYASARDLAWPKRRRIALIGTRQPPHPSMHLCSAFRRLFKATNKAVAASQTLTREGSALASHTAWGTWVAPTSAPSGNPSALQAVGMLDWAGCPLHLTVTDAASASRTTGFPVEVAHVIGSSALLLCFSPYDRDSFVAIQQLFHGVITSLAPCRMILVAVVDHEVDTSDTRHSSLRQAGPSAKVRVGHRAISHPNTTGIFTDRTVNRATKERVVPIAEAESLASEWGCESVEVGVMSPDPEKLTRIIELALGMPPTVSCRAPPKWRPTDDSDKNRSSRHHNVTETGAVPPTRFDSDGNKARSMPRPLARPAKARAECNVC
jgi:hypothetical protein